MIDKKVLTGVFAAIGASLCCITPVLAVLAGSTGLASSFSWMEPFRPYLIALTVLVLTYAWWDKLKPVKEGWIVLVILMTMARSHFGIHKHF